MCSTCGAASAPGASAGGPRPARERPAAGVVDRVVAGALAAQLVALVGRHHQRAQAGERIAGDEAVRDQFGQRLLDLRAQQPGVMLQVGKEARAVRAQQIEHLARGAGQHRLVDHRRAGRLLPMGEGVAFAQQHRRAADRPCLAVRRVARLRRPPPRDAPHGAQLVQHVGHVVADARRQEILFPGRRRRRDDLRAGAARRPVRLRLRDARRRRSSRAGASGTGSA